jgi:hypothetical protein
MTPKAQARARYTTSDRDTSLLTIRPLWAAMAIFVAAARTASFSI